ncbi:DUF6492 family protein [Thermobacillus sp.]|jgi:hypothetical protein|uniref:DUF6492 family protein n=1 Tax=Thermobacillus sp. TaxID=2108467 RepID=UPI0025802052|nr:DUF6492 family protein [Thermobacillus sp.]
MRTNRGELMTAGLVHISGSGEPIDVLIPAVDKDAGTLPHTIDSIRSMVRHPIGTIYVVSPDSPRIRAICARKGCVFVNERLIEPLPKSRIRYRSKRWERSGWLYQQLLKLSGDRLVRRRHFLVMDADTVLIRPHRFRIGGKTVFYYRRWSQPEYFRTYRRLTGRRRKAKVSFVAHYMLFDRHKLYRFKAMLEARHGKPWYRAIIDSIDRTRNFGFSEYETYGNMVYGENPSAVKLLPARNLHLRRGASSLTPAERRRYARNYRSLSFHKRGVYSRGQRRIARKKRPLKSRRRRASK